VTNISSLDRHRIKRVPTASVLTAEERCRAPGIVILALVLRAKRRSDERSNGRIGARRSLSSARNANGNGPSVARTFVRSRWCAASTSRASFPDRDARREGYFQLSAGSLAPMLLGRVDPSETSTFSSMSGRWRSRVSCVWTDNFAFLLATSERRIVTVRQVGKHMSVCVRRPRVSLRYHRGSVSALEAQQPFGRVAIHARRE